ncbi:MAG: hypothetical protein PVF87_07020 [Acidimicrobiia bacterium]
MIRRAGPEDRDELLGLIAEFYEVDGHPYDRETVMAGLVPLLEPATTEWSCPGDRRRIRRVVLELEPGVRGP